MKQRNWHKSQNQEEDHEKNDRKRNSAPFAATSTTLNPLNRFLGFRFKHKSYSSLSDEESSWVFQRTEVEEHEDDICTFDSSEDIRTFDSSLMLSKLSKSSSCHSLGSVTSSSSSSHARRKTPTIPVVSLLPPMPDEEEDPSLQCYSFSSSSPSKTSSSPSPSPSSSSPSLSNPIRTIDTPQSLVSVSSPVTTQSGTIKQEQRSAQSGTSQQVKDVFEYSGVSIRKTTPESFQCHRKDHESQEAREVEVETEDEYDNHATPNTTPSSSVPSSLLHATDEHRHEQGKQQQKEAKQENQLSETASARKLSPNTTSTSEIAEKLSSKGFKDSNYRLTFTSSGLNVGISTNPASPLPEQQLPQNFNPELKLSDGIGSSQNHHSTLTAFFHAILAVSPVCSEPSRTTEEEDIAADRSSNDSIIRKLEWSDIQEETQEQTQEETQECPINETEKDFQEEKDTKRQQPEMVSVSSKLKVLGKVDEEGAVRIATVGSCRQASTRVMNTWTLFQSQTDANVGRLGLSPLSVRHQRSEDDSSNNQGIPMSPLPTPGNDTSIQPNQCSTAKLREQDINSSGRQEREANRCDSTATSEDDGKKADGDDFGDVAIPSGLNPVTLEHQLPRKSLESKETTEDDTMSVSENTSCNDGNIVEQRVLSRVRSAPVLVEEEGNVEILAGRSPIKLVHCSRSTSSKSDSATSCDVTSEDEILPSGRVDAPDWKQKKEESFSRSSPKDAEKKVLFPEEESPCSANPLCQVNGKNSRTSNVKDSKLADEESTEAISAPTDEENSPCMSPKEGCTLSKFDQFPSMLTQPVPLTSSNPMRTVGRIGDQNHLGNITLNPAKVGPRSASRNTVIRVKNQPFSLGRPLVSNSDNSPSFQPTRVVSPDDERKDTSVRSSFAWETLRRLPRELQSDSCSEDDDSGYYSDFCETNESDLKMEKILPHRRAYMGEGGTDSEDEIMDPESFYYQSDYSTTFTVVNIHPVEDACNVSI